MRPIDLALHLPLRNEDETRITPLKNAREGSVVQIDATVTACEVQQRPRRQLVVDDGMATWALRSSRAGSATSPQPCEPCQGR